MLKGYYRIATCISLIKNNEPLTPEATATLDNLKQYPPDNANFYDLLGKEIKELTGFQDETPVSNLRNSCMLEYISHWDCDASDESDSEVSVPKCPFLDSMTLLENTVKEWRTHGYKFDALIPLLDRARSLSDHIYYDECKLPYCSDMIDLLKDYYTFAKCIALVKNPASGIPDSTILEQIRTHTTGNANFYKLLEQEIKELAGKPDIPEESTDSAWFRPSKSHAPKYPFHHHVALLEDTFQAWRCNNYIPEKLTPILEGKQMLTDAITQAGGDEEANPYVIKVLDKYYNFANCISLVKHPSLGVPDAEILDQIKNKTRVSIKRYRLLEKEIQELADLADDAV